MNPVAAEFFGRGYVVLPRVLAPDAVASFLTSIDADLATLDNAESGKAFSGPLSLADPGTWPAGKARRVAESAPVGGDAPHWAALRGAPQLCAALDAIMGGGGWELPMNAAGADGKLVGPRHWYAPVAFPEAPPSAAGTPTSATARVADDWADEHGAGGGYPGGCAGPRRALFVSSLEEQAAHGPPSPATAHRRWQPVSRRRFCNKGWHIDIGPGFPTDGRRSLSPADAAQDQGPVLLLLLTDWAPGGGGTAMIPHSHLWVARELARCEAAGEAVTHEALNQRLVDALRHATETQGRVVLRCGCGDPTHEAPSALAAVATPAPAAPPGAAGPAAVALLPNDIAGAAPIAVEQIVGAAGDVVLMHPLLLHSGTANMLQGARVMVNGMARVPAGRFAAPTAGGGGGGNAVTARTAVEYAAALAAAAAAAGVPPADAAASAPTLPAPAPRAPPAPPPPAPPRAVARVLSPGFVAEGDGFSVRRPLGEGAAVEHVGGWLLMVDHLGPTCFKPGRALGTPAHPHRGQCTLTYLLAGGLRHADSGSGRSGTLSPGWAQWMVAGRGVVHLEAPSEELLRDGGVMEGLQLWINLPPREKMCKPRYVDLPPERSPVVELAPLPPAGGGAADAAPARGAGTARVLVGGLLGAASPVRAVTPVTVADVRLAHPGAAYALPLEAGHEVAVYAYRGAALVGPPGKEQLVEEGHCAVLAGAAGESSLRAACAPGGPGGVGFLLLSGAPIDGPIARKGPFVMCTEKQLAQAADDYRAGRMRSLPLPGASAAAPAAASSGGSGGGAGGDGRKGGGGGKKGGGRGKGRRRGDSSGSDA